MSPITISPPLRVPSQKHHFLGCCCLKQEQIKLQADKEKRDFTCDYTSHVYLKGSPTSTGKKGGEPSLKVSVHLCNIHTWKEGCSSVSPDFHGDQGRCTATDK